MLQLPLFGSESDWRPPELGSLPNWKNAKRIGLDIETCDPNLKKTGPSVRTGGFICGVSFALEGDVYPEEWPVVSQRGQQRGYYLPLRHFGGNNVPLDGALFYLISQAREFKGELVGANFQYDLDYLAEEGILFPNVHRFRDIQIADPLLYEMHDSYSLDAIAKRYGYGGKSETLLKRAARDYGVDPKAEMWKLPARFVGPYAEDDAVLAVQIIAKQEIELERQDLMGVYDLESKLQPILLGMRRQGVRIDLDKLAHIEDVMQQAELTDAKELTRRTGIIVGLGDVNKKKTTAAILDKIGVRFKMTPTGLPKIDKEMLEKVDHPITDMIIHARKVNKIRTTFCRSVRDHAVGDRIHATFNQLRSTGKHGSESGAKYGRLSCSNPNMQQQPARDPEYASLWRSIYVPDHEGQLWCSADYSQQEPRMVVHFSELMGLHGSLAAGEAYRNDPSTDNHAMMTRMIWPELAKLHDKDPEFVKARKYAKAIFLGLCYGMGSGKLAQNLGLSTETKARRNGSTYLVAGPEGRKLLNLFERRVPYVKRLADKAEKRAKARGYIRTLSGRKCRFPLQADGTFDWTFKALNRLIQGSSADQTKMAMVAIAEAGLPMALQVHDEVCSGVDNIEVAREIAHTMETCLPLGVPSKVDIEIGPNWGEAEEIAA